MLGAYDGERGGLRFDRFDESKLAAKALGFARGGVTSAVSRIVPLFLLARVLPLLRGREVRLR